MNKFNRSGTKFINAIQFPAKQYNTLVPWYIIAIRLPFIPIVYLGLSITFFGLFFTSGLVRAIDWWKEQGISIV